MLNEIGDQLRGQRVRLVLAGEDRSVRDMLAAVVENGQVPEFHRTIDEAVDAVGADISSTSDEEV